MPTFQELASTIRKDIGDFQIKVRAFSDVSVRFIAEPGRYFASASTAVATKVYSRKGGNGVSPQVLYVDDGVYGSFNNVLYDHATPVPEKMWIKQRVPSLISTLPTTVFGPTCDGLDQMCDHRHAVLPRCEVGDWLLWENMGAYTHTASFVFNGFTHIPSKIHCVL